jgi:hypothetical protein
MIELIISIGIVCFLLMYLALNLDKEHFFLKFFLVGFIFALLFLIPKAVIDSQETCEIVLNNTEEIFNFTNNHTDTTHSYKQVCFNNDSPTNISFLKAIGGLFNIFLTYIVVYIFYYWVKKLVDKIRKRK